MEDPWMKYTTYSCKGEYEADMNGELENEKPKDGCWNCMMYDGDRCTKEWNNLDPCYYISWRDDKDPDDYCEDWELEPGAIYEDFFGGNEP